MRYLSFVCLSSLALFCFGCDTGDGGGGETTSTEVKQTAEKAGQTTSDDADAQKTHAQKEVFTKEMEKKFESLSKQMEELKEKGNNLSRESKERWEKRMSRLQEQQETLTKQLREAANASEEQWQEFSKNISDAYQQLETGLKKAADDLQDPTQDGERQ
jgi:chromosome segregation ATPase